VRAGRIAARLPRRDDYRELPRSWRTDLLAGTTVAVVALPLALAFGVASGLGARAGIVTAIVAGVVAGACGGSHVQVSGPTGAMTVVLVPVVAALGPSAVALVALLAGVLLMVAGASRLGRCAAILPWPVVEGFTLGIAVLIFLQQVPAALGVAKPDGTNTAAVAARAAADWAAGGWAAPAVVALVAAVMVILPRLHRGLPASLIAVVTGTVLAQTAGLDVAPIGDIPAGLPTPTLPGLSLQHAGQILSAVGAVAALAAIESLLSAKVADGEPHDPDRELVGQGAANVAVAFAGGMPATGAIARTAVNVRAGARTRAAAVVHGAVLALIALALTPALERVPLAALAGVLMVTAVRMVEFGTVARILRSTRSDALLLATTATATVVFDLIVAVGIGVALASLLALRAMGRQHHLRSRGPRDDRGARRRRDARARAARGAHRRLPARRRALLRRRPALPPRADRGQRRRGRDPAARAPAGARQHRRAGPGRSHHPPRAPRHHGAAGIGPARARAAARARRRAASAGARQPSAAGHRRGAAPRAAPSPAQPRGRPAGARLSRLSRCR
jgi:SulP family sulfate permease